MAVPTFHATGVMIQCLKSLYQGYTQVLFAPRSDPVVPTPDLTLQALSDTDCETTLAWPAFLETWAEDQEAISRLKRFKTILFGGGPLAERIGDHLVTNGVNIQIGYGGTEFGAGSHPCPPGYDPRDWIYFQFSPQMNVKLVPQYDEQGSHEVYFLLGPDNKPFVINSSLDGTPAYSTKDLVAPHPKKQGLWKLVGRADDQITLSNGEKINPGPIENSVLKSPLVQFAVMFGREKSQCGVLLELTNDGKELFLKGRAEIVESICVSRPSALKMYAEGIERMYAALEKSEDVTRDNEAPSSWSDLAAVENWIQRCVESILGQKIDIEGDLFQQGLDSLTAAILLRTIKSSMHTSFDETVRAAEANTSRNTVFEHPTVKQLASHLVRLWDGDIGDSPSQDRSDAAIIEELRLTIQKYQLGDNGLRARTGSNPLKESVILTGGTGGLGCHLLAGLLSDDNVQRVWVLNRKSRDITQGAEEKQAMAFEDKLLDVKLLENPKLVILEANLAAEQCGLAQESYKQIQSKATMIIHNAWQVNFNLTLPSFAPSLQGVQNLLKLSFSSTAPTGAPRFIFTSSISVLGFDSSDEPLKEEYISLEHGGKNIGYGRSKLVAEKLLERAGTFGLETCSIRLGQLTGDEKSGAWSINDWVPAMIASSVSIGFLPISSGVASWIPLDTAARVVHEVCMKRNVKLPPVIHCCHPKTTCWSKLIEMFADVLDSRVSNSTKLGTLPFNGWSEKVATAASNFEGSEDEQYQKFPSMKIQDVYGCMIQSVHGAKSGDGISSRSGEAGSLDIKEAQKMSGTLRSAPALDRAHVDKWVTYWEKKGLFAQNA
ncbi:hypothetical protein FRC09_001485 [Ceratobasidium sp. 395]|nr:hypothetical protein FRC09_001485 [Ceratobasidium sp. 395]